MRQPEGLSVPGRESEVCLLKKSIYGLKQAPRCWNDRFNEFLLKYGLSRSQDDSCLYYRRQGEEFLLIAIFVDDGLLCSNRSETIQDVCSFLAREFEMRTSSVDRFLNINVTRDRSNRTITLDQRHYIQETLEKYGMGESNLRATPAKPGIHLSISQRPDSEEERQYMRKVPYREAVGSLLYLMSMTRPDIAFAVNRVAQHSEDPGLPHWRAIKRILAYLSGIRLHGIRFTKTINPTLSLATQTLTTGVTLTIDVQLVDTLSS